MISTGYQLPFRFLYSQGVFSAGLPAHVHIRFARAEAAEELSAVVAAFASLASSGALCGADIDPVRSSLRLQASPSASSNDLYWSFDEALLADEALVVLAHLLYATHERSEVDLVEVVTHAADVPQPLVCDRSLDSTYPPRAKALGFALEDDDPEGEAFAFEIELQAALEPKSRAWLGALLEVWARVVTLGGFASAPLPPEESYLEPEDEITAYDSTIEWSVFKLRADPACIDTLINGFAAFSARCQQIVTIAIR